MENDNVYIGIDPGVNGCISAIYESSGEVKTHMMPVSSGVVCGDGIAAIVAEIIGNNNYSICVEQVHAIFGSSASSTFSFGYGVGVVHGALSAIGCKFSQVQPKMWQKAVWKPSDIVLKNGTAKKDTKATSIAAAKRLYPNLSLRRSSRCRKDDDGVADSVLIAHYCKNFLK